MVSNNRGVALVVCKSSKTRSSHSDNTWKSPRVPYIYKLQCPASPRGQHPGNSLITQIIDLQTLFAINDRQTVQTETQTDRQVAFIGRDYSRKYLKMRLMVGEAEEV